MRVSDLVYRTGQTIYSAEHLHETHNRITENYKREKQTEAHATWIEFIFEICGTAKFVLQWLVTKVENWNI